MAGAQALGGVRVARPRRRASRSSTGRWSSTSSRWRRRPASCRAQVALVTGGAGGIGRAIGEALAARGRRRGRLRPRPGGRRGRRSRRYGDARAGGRRRRDQRGRGRGRLRRGGRRVRRRRHRRLQRRDRVERRRSRTRRWPSGTATTRILVHRLLPRRARGVPRPARAGHAAARSSSSPPRTRWWPARTRRPTRRPRRPSCTSRAAWPRRAARRASASTPSTPTRCSRARGSGARSLARGARRGLRHRARRAGGALPPAHHARGQHPARRTSPQAVLHFASDGALGQEHRQPAQRRRRRRRRLPR